MNRIESLCHFFGWQGGTIHQISDITGVDSTILLNGEIQDKSGMSANNGWFLHRTCSSEHRIAKSREYHGDSDFWLSAAEAGKIPFND